MPVLFDHVRRSEDGLHFLVGAEVLVLAVDLAVLDHAVRRDQEAVFVDVGLDRQRGDQADVGAFRRFDRTDSAVVRDMHVAHFEARRLRFKPPGPRADRRRSWVSCDSGLVWSTTCDSSPRPKKKSIELLMLLLFTSSAMQPSSLGSFSSCAPERCA